MLIEVIFYYSFKQKLRLIDEFRKQRCTIEDFEGYLCVSRSINMN